MTRKSLEFHEYKRDLYKRLGMWAAMTCEELAIEGIKAKARHLKREKP